MKKLSELDAIKYTLKALTRVQTREDKRHIMDAHLNAEMREYLEEAIEYLERIDNYDPTPIDTPYREFYESKKKRLKEEPWVKLELRRDVLCYVYDFLNRTKDHGIVGAVLEPYEAHEEFVKAADLTLGIEAKKCDDYLFGDCEAEDLK